MFGVAVCVMGVLLAELRSLSFASISDLAEVIASNLASESSVQNNLGKPLELLDAAGVVDCLDDVVGFDAHGVSPLCVLGDPVVPPMRTNILTL